MNVLGFPESPPAYRSRWILAHPAQSAWELGRHFALRTEVFVHEQGLFREHDRDVHDDHAVAIVALSTSAGVPTDVIGTVRVYEAEPGIWYGGRLAVTADYRRCREVGGALTRAAVGSARGWGATRFLATVQRENEAFFTRYHFHTLRAVELYGRPHCLMEAQLSAFAVPAWCSAVRSGRTRTDYRTVREPAA